ncbi:hypothetical protein Y032_0006g2981 [Ancylostoma ceylanicum]|uniref:BED-type domain-containing protein n=2 Tax=Ancylostoma TaxID=29169 RepID=A0A016VQ56_9BILA|nr:hypothetical protein Y032_0006g2981 [Ancylostoma ceylanicum]
MDTAYLPTSYSYEDKDYFEPSVAVLQTPCSFQQPQHGHLYPIVPQPIPIQGGTQLPGNDQYEQSLSLQPSMFYYAAAAAAGPSLISQQDQPPAVLQNKTTVDDDNGAGSNGARKRGTKRGRPTKNPVWTFFRRIDDKSVQCNMCARLVKSACATNMSKHLERHHQNAGLTAGGAMDRLFSTSGVVVESVRSSDAALEARSILVLLVVVTSYDHYQGIPDSQRQMAGVPWNPDRRGAKRNRRTKHPVWELFRRTTDGNAQCILCSVVVRSPCSSNFMGHLNRHHSEHYQDIYSRWLEGRVDMPSLPS